MADDRDSQSRGILVTRRRSAAPWCVEAGARRAASIHVVVEGAFAMREGDPRMQPLGAGDLVIAGVGAEVTIHCVARSANTNADPKQAEGELISAVFAPDERLARIDPVTRLCAADARREPGIAVLVGLLRSALADASAGRERLARSLVEPLIAHVLHCLEAMRGGATSSGSGLVDEQVARVLSLMRSFPARRWTVSSLAKAAGLSRAAFARRFRALLGVSPLRYLADLRMDCAARLLAEGDEALAFIAGQVGYASEFAFSRAFKRRTGEAPIVYRRRSRTERGVMRMPVIRAAA